MQIRCPTFLYIFLHKFSRNYIVSRMKRIFKEGKAIDSNRSATAVLMLECIVSEQNPDFCCIYGKHLCIRQILLFVNMLGPYLINVIGTIKESIQDIQNHCHMLSTLF